jgi:2-aminoadipate transaminase
MPLNRDRLFSRAAARMQESAIRQMEAIGSRVADCVSLAPGFPAPELFAWDAFGEIAKSLLDGSDGSVLQYGATRGYGRLVEALSDILRERGIRAAREEIVVTTGSQQGLDLAARVFVDPGDVVLVELPTYPGAITAFRNVQASLVGVRQDEGGIDLNDLDRVVERERAAGRRVALLYVVPNFQNPTGRLMTGDRRRQLLAWAGRHEMLVIEDDPYGALYFEELATAAETRPIKADDVEGWVVYLSSFSKTVAPGFRVAWVNAEAPIAAKLEVAKQAADLCTGALDQRMVYEVWKRGILSARLEMMRSFYQRKRQVLEESLRRELPGLMSWETPKGGFFLWVSFPPGVDTSNLLVRAQAHGLAFVAGSAFFVDGRRSHHARLSFSATPALRIEEGVRRLSSALEEELAATGSGGGREAPVRPWE